MAEPCWILVHPSGDVVKDGDGDILHFPTEAIADGLTDRNQRGGLAAVPQRLDRSCVILSCPCCEAVLDEEEGGVLHFSGPVEAETTAPDYGWRRDADGSWRCGYCVTGPCDQEADTHG